VQLASPRFTERELTLPPDLGRLPDVRDFVESAARDMGFSEQSVYALKLAVSEAVANAVEHGSPSPEDTVVVRAAPEADGLSLLVEDRGHFRPRVSREGGLAERGRGFEFMSELMDEVDLRAGPAGTTVRLTKRLPE
jgi:serine/threonine-protein kinase RsbW